jgi:hypothetical protein
MPRLQVYDPAMCCSTGVCGPAVDPALVRFAADLDWLKEMGVEVERFNLSQAPAAFVGNTVVVEAMRGRGDALPLLLLDGAIVAQGAYPARQALAQIVGLEAPRPEPQPPKSGCCAPADPPVDLDPPGTPRKCC